MSADVAPELDEDDVDTPFKRRVAVLVAFLALAGATSGLLAAHSSAHGNQKSRDAEMHAIVEASQRAAAAARGRIAELAALELDTFSRRAQLARSRAFFSRAPAALQEEAALWAQVAERTKERLKSTSPGLSDEPYAQAPARYSTDLALEATREALRQESLRETADAWGYKTGRYTAVVTLLAVSLSLLGLSVTVGGAARRVLLVPAMLIAAAGLLAMAYYVIRRVPTTPAAAEAHVIEGARLFAIDDYDGAIHEYTRALAWRPDYVTALHLRAEAHFVRGSPQADETTLISVTSPEALRRAIADNEKAIKHGGGDRFDVVADLGFQYFLQQHYDKAEVFTRDALKLSDANPAVQANLAVILLAKGDVDGAEKAYEKAAADIDSRPDQVERTELVSGAVTDLEVLAQVTPDRLPLIRRFQGRLVDHRKDSPASLPEGSGITNATVSFRGSGFLLSYDHRNVPPGTLLSYLAFFRPDPASPWRERTPLFHQEKHAAGSIPGRRELPPLDDQRCPTSGEYRFDIYANRTLVASVATARRPVGEAWTYEAEPTSGLVFCRPSGWSAGERGEGFVRIESPGSGVSISARVERGVRSAADSRAAALSAITQFARAEGMVAAGSGPRSVATGFLDSAGNKGQLPGWLEVYRRRDRPESAAIWASLGSDGVLRTIVVRGKAQEVVDSLVDDVMYTASFRQRPT